MVFVSVNEIPCVDVGDLMVFVIVNEMPCVSGSGGRAESQHPAEGSHHGHAVQTGEHVCVVPGSQYAAQTGEHVCAVPGSQHAAQTGEHICVW